MARHQREVERDRAHQLIPTLHVARDERVVRVRRAPRQMSGVVLGHPVSPSSAAAPPANGAIKPAASADLRDSPGDGVGMKNIKLSWQTRQVTQIALQASCSQ
jgi:hypothetical protein